MHAVKGQNQYLFAMLAPGNQMAASVKEMSFFSFYLEGGHKCTCGK